MGAALCLGLYLVRQVKKPHPLVGRFLARLMNRSHALTDWAFTRSGDSHRRDGVGRGLRRWTDNHQAGADGGASVTELVREQLAMEDDTGRISLHGPEALLTPLISNGGIPAVREGSRIHLDRKDLESLDRTAEVPLIPECRPS
jgi:hypothetical protein